MLDNVKDVLKELKIEDTGVYKNHFYILNLENSDEYAKMYTKLSNNATNTEYPYFEENTNKTTTKVTNYFEFELDDNNKYNIFLIADFNEDDYILKIGER